MTRLVASMLFAVALCGCDHKTYPASAAVEYPCVPIVAHNEVQVADDRTSVLRHAITYRLPSGRLCVNTARDPSWSIELSYMHGVRAGIDRHWFDDDGGFRKLRREYLPYDPCRVRA